MSDSSKIDERRIELSESAIKRLSEMLAAEADEGLKLRIAVHGGGCSGFQYGFSFDDSINDDDLVFEQGGITAVIDEASLDVLQGSTIDYVEDLIGSTFQIKNPAFTASCGCGSSFSV